MITTSRHEECLQQFVAPDVDGMELTGPGLLPLAQWPGSGPATTSGSDLICYCGTARKPRRG